MSVDCGTNLVNRPDWLWLPCVALSDDPKDSEKLGLESSGTGANGLWCFSHAGLSDEIGMTFSDAEFLEYVTNKFYTAELLDA